MLAADVPFNVELLLLIVAAVIGGLAKLYEIVKGFRERVKERERTREEAVGVEFDDSASVFAPPPMPGSVVPSPAPEVPSMRRPPRLQLGAEGPAPVAPPPPRVRRPARPVAPVERHETAARASVRELLTRGHPGLRDAIVLHEILGPPRAMRPWRRHS